LPLYLDLIEAIGLGAAIRQHVHVAGAQGWLDIQMVLALIFLNLAGGDCVEDLERLEADSGFAAVLRAIERDVLSSTERRLLKKRWRRPRERTVPSPSAASGVVQNRPFLGNRRARGIGRPSRVGLGRRGCFVRWRRSASLTQVRRF